MSDNISQTVQATAPTRREWSEFSQGICQLLRDSFQYHNNSALCECTILEELAKLHQEVVIDGVRKTVRSVVRGFEFSPSDAFILLIDEDAEHVPAADASNYDLWRWARAQPKGVTFIPIDAKLSSFTIGHKVDDRHKHYFHWTNNESYKDRVTDSEVIFGMVEGVPDHVAVVPTRTWIEASHGSYGIETLIGKAPLWMPLFMVHYRDLPEAVERIATAARDSKRPYINPTTNIRLGGWRPQAYTEPEMRTAWEKSTGTKMPGKRTMFDPSGDNIHRHVSFEATLELFDYIESSNTGCRIQLNPVAPLSYDFGVEIPDVGLVRLEFKSFSSVQAMRYAFDTEPRSDPFSDNRTWHVFYLQIGQRTFCITRDEISGKTTKDIDWIEAHEVTDFAETVAHVTAHAQEAKDEVMRAMHRARPEDIVSSLPQREVVLDTGSMDPLIGHERHQITLPWLQHLINTQCMRDGLGICFSLGEGNAAGTHVFIQHEWTSAQKKAFRRFGKLPLDPWSPKALDARCVVLRFHDHSKAPELSNPLAVRRHQWKQPIRDMRHFLIVGWKGRGEDEYLLLPSHLTAFSSDKDCLLEPTDKSGGGHFFHCEKNSNTELKDPAFPSKKRAVVTFNEHVIPDPSVKVTTWLCDLMDGTLNAQIRAVLYGQGQVQIGSTEFRSQNKAFLREMYHRTFREVLQTTWNFGYERAFRQKKNKGAEGTENDR